MKKSIGYKRSIIAVLIIMMVCAALTGCADTAVSETGTATTATATPVPPPKEGAEAVFGKNITIEAISNGSEEESELFFAGAQAEAESLGVALNTDAAGIDFNGAVSGAAKNGADAVIACLINKQSSYVALNVTAEKGIPVALFEMEKGGVSEGISHIYYDPDNEVKLAYDAALNFPPHDTPVRLILMFERKESDSYTLFQQLYDEGKIFPKEVYIASEEEEPAADWLTAKLDDYIEGMLDAVYAADTDLALSALDALEALGRTDMEVFCPGVTYETLKRMEKDPEVFAQAAGADMYLAGVLSVRAALKGIKGEGSVTLGMQPALINASDLAENGARAFADMSGETAATWSEDWMDYLREYYGSGK